MKLELYIRGSFMVTVDLTPPNKDYFMDFESNYHVRESYIKWMTESLKNKYQRAMENSEWEIVLIAESKMNEPIEPEIREYLKIKV